MATSSTTAEPLDSVPGELPDDPAGVLAFVRARRRAAEAAEVDLLRAAVQWVIQHPVDSVHPYGDAAVYSAPGALGGMETDLTIAGEGAPRMAEFAVAEFASCVGKSTEAGKAYLGEAVELRYRLPRLWAGVLAGDVAAWKARLVARETIRLTQVAAAWVDRQVAPVTGRVGPVQLDRIVHEAIGRHMPDEVTRLAEASWDRRHVTVYDQLVSFTGTMTVGAELDIADALDLDAALAAGAEQRTALGSTESLDVRRAQALGDLARGQVAFDLDPATNHDTGLDDAVRAAGVKPRQAVLYVHISDAALAGSDPVARLERSNTVVSVDQVRSWCGSPETTRVTVTPVLDLDACTHADCDRVPARIADHVAVRDRTCVFPWCTRPSRSCDKDHVIPYGHAPGKDGVTCSCNLAPLCRRHHRLKTHTAWTYLVVDPGTYLWTSPHGYQLLRDPTGTRELTPDQPEHNRPRPSRPPDT